MCDVIIPVQIMPTRCGEGHDEPDDIPFEMTEKLQFSEPQPETIALLAELEEIAPLQLTCVLIGRNEGLKFHTINVRILMPNKSLPLLLVIRTPDGSFTTASRVFTYCALEEVMFENEGVTERQGKIIFRYWLNCIYPTLAATPVHWPEREEALKLIRESLMREQ